LAYNLGNKWRRLVLPKRIDHWSLTSLQQRLVKTVGRLVKHARYDRFLRCRRSVGREAQQDDVSEKWHREEVVQVRPPVPDRPKRGLGAVNGSRGEQTGLQLPTRRRSGVYCQPSVI